MDAPKRTRKRINVKAVLILAVAAAAVAATVHFVHAHQAQRNVSALAEEAAAAETAGKLAEAADLLGQYLLMNPDDSDARARLGLIQSRAARGPNQLTAAYVSLNAALRNAPDRQDVRREMARLALNLGRPHEAREHLLELRKASAGKDDPELAKLQAQCEAAQSQFSTASTWYDTAVRLAPTDVELSTEWAALLRSKLGRAEAADNEVNRLVQATGGSAAARLAAGQYFARWDNAKRAEEVITDEAGNARSGDPALLLLATDLALSATPPRTDAARRHAERGAREHPKDMRFARRLARLEAYAGRPDQALVLLKPSLETPPEQPEELWQLANLLIDLNQVDRVEQLAGRLGPTVVPWVADFLRGRAYFRKGSWAEARIALGRAAGTLTQPPQLVADVNLLLAECYRQLNNPDLRVAALRKAVAADPKLVTARRELAAALAALGKPTEAIVEHRSLIREKSDKSADARIDLAQLLLVQTIRQPEADRKWDEVLALLEDAPAARRSEAQLIQAEVLAAQGKQDDARKLVMAERDRDPKQLGPWLFLIAFAERGPRPEAALDIVAEAERATGPRAEWVILRARNLARGGPESAKRLADLEAGLASAPATVVDPALVELGQAFLTAGDPAAAVRLWRRAADRRTNDLDSRFRLFRLAMGKGDEARALELTAEIRRAEGPGGAVGGFCEASLALRKARGGDRAALAVARQNLTQAVEQRPNWSLVILLQAELDEVDGQVAKALERYLAVIEAGEANPQIVRHAVRLLTVEGRYNDARTVLRKLPEQTQDVGNLARASATLAVLDARRSAGPDAAGTRRKALAEARAAIRAESATSADYLWLGEMAVLAGEAAEATQAFRKARDLNPADAAPWVALVTHLAKSDPKAAEAEMTAARGKVPVDRLPLVLAAGHEALGRSKDASEQYQALTAAKAGDPVALQNQAGFLMRTGDREKSEKVLRELLALPKVPDATAAWARRALAVTLIAGNGYSKAKEALALLDQNAAKGGGTIEDARTRALVLTVQPERRAEAIALLEKVNLPASTPPDYRFLLARLYDQAGKWNQAEVELQKLLQDHGKNKNVLTYYAAALIRNGQPRRAEPLVDQLVEADGDAYAVAELRARAKAGLGQAEAASTGLRAYAQKSPEEALKVAVLMDELKLFADAEQLFATQARTSKNPIAPLLYARHLAARGRLPEALDLCEKAWAKVSPEVAGFYSVAVLRAGHGGDDQAKRVEGWLTAAASKNPGLVGLMALRADLMQYRKQFDQAADVYRQMLAQSPRHVVALNNLAFLLAVKDGRAEEALGLIDAAIQEVGLNPELLDTRAVVLTRAGRPDEAVTDLQQAIAANPSPVAQYHLAHAYWKSGRNAEAKKIYRTASSAGFKSPDLHPLEKLEFDRFFIDIERK